jgi:hypothetical protein
MSPLVSYYGEIVEAVLAALTIFLILVSIRAYRARPEPRYLLLMLAFVSLCVVAPSTVSLEFLVGLAPTLVPLVELYLIPSLGLLMVVSFLVALVWTRKGKGVRRWFPCSRSGSQSV